jgi:STE24 endopeptidase
MRLADQTGARVRGVFRINMSKETKKANAALVGLGKTRRIIIGDTLLDNFNNDEIEVVLAHELGHHKKMHLWKLLAFGTIITFIGLYLADVIMKKYLSYFGFNDISDIGAFPLLCLLVLGFSLLAMPLQNGFSRYLESRADMFALKTTRMPEAFISTMEKLARQNLSDTTPSRFIETIMYNHPPVAKRIKMAQGFKKI